MEEKYTTAYYIRLSSEDADLDCQKTESNSIVNQRNLLRSYIYSQKELSNTNIIEYCDDGFSGLTFQRPGIRRLLEDAGSGKLHCIVVKDFSRFGRNYIETGNYLERIFPALGIRFISINDSYDSGQKKSSAMETGIMNLAYELYSRELSEKVKKGKSMSVQKGYFIGSIPPYGYKKMGIS